MSVSMNRKRPSMAIYTSTKPTPGRRVVNRLSVQQTSFRAHDLGINSQGERLPMKLFVSLYCVHHEAVLCTSVLCIYSQIAHNYWLVEQAYFVISTDRYFAYFYPMLTHILLCYYMSSNFMCTPLVGSLHSPKMHCIHLCSTQITCIPHSTCM